jgi:uncharacterized protein (DUF2252 family)
MAVRRVAHPSVDDRKAVGLEARDQAALSSHTKWRPAADRPDPVDLLEDQDTTREPDLVPIRHGRMMVSPFTFYRGAAKIMAVDLKDTPVAGLEVQLCGDAHLSNFGLFASPERILLFDVNDFDETLPGPFEYDVKRMAASFTIAARNNRFAKADTREVTLASVRAYREAMASFAQMGTMDIWYAHLDEDELMASIRSAAAETATQEKKARKQEKTDRRAKAPKKVKRAANREKADRHEEQAEKRAERRAEKTAAKAHTRDSLQALSKLGELVDGKYRIVSQPPIVVPARELAATAGLSPDEVDHMIREQFRAYRATLQDDQRRLLERFEIVDMARKVVGVGSVGTRAFIVLLQGRDARDPLFLQVKEATASVLEGHLPRSRYRQHGERVVQGQRMMQAARLDKTGKAEPPLLLAPAARHEGLRGRRAGETGRTHVLRADLRLDTGAGPRPVRGPGRHRRVPGRQRRARQIGHRLLRALRRPERAGLPAVRERGRFREAGSGRGRLTIR